MNSILTAPLLAAFLDSAGRGVLLISVLVFVVFFVLPALLQCLWNTTIPGIFGLPTITFWQAFRLFLICGILFGGLFR